MGNKKVKNPYKVANPALAEGARQIAFSNKAGTHDNRPNRQRTRATTKRHAISNSW